MPLPTDYIGFIAGEQKQAGDGIKPAVHYSGLIDEHAAGSQDYKHSPDKLLAISVRVLPKDLSNVEVNLAQMKLEIEGILRLSGIREYKVNNFIRAEGTKMLGKETASNIYSITFGDIASSDYPRLVRTIGELEKLRSREHAIKIESDEQISPPQNLPNTKLPRSKIPGIADINLK